MSDDINDSINKEADIILALDQLTDTMETISEAIEHLKHSVADAQHSLIEKYNATQAEKRVKELKEAKRHETEKVMTKKNASSSKDENSRMIFDAPIIIH